MYMPAGFADLHCVGVHQYDGGLRFFILLLKKKTRNFHGFKSPKMVARVSFSKGILKMYEYIYPILSFLPGSRSH